MLIKGPFSMCFAYKLIDPKNGLLKTEMVCRIMEYFARASNILEYWSLGSHAFHCIHKHSIFLFEGRGEERSLQKLDRRASDFSVKRPHKLECI